MQWSLGDYRLTDDPARLELTAICALLAGTYWAADRSPAAMAQAMQHSLCVGLFHGARQIGFARAVTDYTTFAWICDVVVHSEYRGKGLGKWMVQCLIEHPRLQTRSQVLATRDAHGLYEQFGFQRTEYLRRKPGELAPPGRPPPPQ